MYNLGIERKSAFQDLVDIDTNLDDAIALIAIFVKLEEDEKRKEVEKKRRKIPNCKGINAQCIDINLIYM